MIPIIWTFFTCCGLFYWLNLCTLVLCTGNVQECSVLLQECLSAVLDKCIMCGLIFILQSVCLDNIDILIMQYVCVFYCFCSGLYYIMKEIVVIKDYLVNLFHNVEYRWLKSNIYIYEACEVHNILTLRIKRQFCDTPLCNF